MFVYLSFIAVILSLISINKIVGKPHEPYLGLRFIILFLILFAALRYDVGVDYMTYYDIIHLQKVGAILRTEPLNQLIFFVTSYFDSPFYCFLIYAILTYFFVYKACVNNSVSPYWSIFLYITLFYLESLGYIRQAVAIAIGMYAFKYVQTKRVKLYCIWIGIAMLFHLSSIILLSVYFIYWKVRLKYAIGIGTLVLLLKNALFSILTSLNFYSGYVDKEIVGGGKLRYLYPLLLLLIFTLHSNMNREKERLYAVCFLALPFPFVFPAHTGMRISNYFFCYICFLVPQMLIQSSYKIKILFTYLTAAIFFIYILISKYYIPYTLYWNK